MTFSNNVSYMVKILTFYTIMTWILNHVIKSSILTLALKLHDLSWIIYDTYEGWKSKTTIDNKVRAIEQIFVLDSVN